MRIALLTDGIYPYVMGGMQRHSYYMAKYLSRRKIYVTLVHFNLSQFDIARLELFTDDEKAYIKSIVVPFPKGDKFPGHYIRSSYKYSCQIYELLKDRLQEFDFIYAKGFSAWKFIEEKNKDPGRFPPIGVKFHGYEMFQKGGKLIILLHQQLLRRPVKWVTLNADYVFSYGGKITGLIKSLGVNDDKILEISAGIESHWLAEGIRSSDPPVRFTFMGRYERRKGVEELNLALRQLISEGVDFRFDFIGPFNEHEKVKSDKIQYYGLINDSEALKDKLDTSEILVCPSWSEGMPNVILEAMSRGCAVIATDVGAISLMVDESNGMLIQAGNIGQLCEAIRKMCKLEKTKLDRMKARSLEKVKNQFLFDIVIDKFLSKIHDIIHREQ